jgi:hypothetical protein
VDDAINKTIDGATKKPTNTEKTNKTSEQSNPTLKKENKTTDNKTNKEDESNATTSMEPQDGYIQAKVFPYQTLIGAPVVISGETMYSDKHKEVNISIWAAKGSNDKKNYKAIIQQDGKFKFPFNGTEKEGDYSAIVSSPDGKAQKKLSFTIYDFDGLDEIGEKIKDLMDEASKNLKQIVDKIKSEAAAKDDKEIDAKMKEAEDKIEAGEKMLTSINEACGKLGKAAKEGKGMPQYVRENLGELNDIFKKQESVMKEQVERAKHKPADNTICEYLVILNEACAAFSTFTNFYGKTILGSLKSIAIDKGITKGVETANKAAKIKAPDDDFWAKESEKLTVTAVDDVKAFSDGLGKAGVAGDLIQYASDVLLKKYCGTYSGEMQYHYEIVFRDQGQDWWHYSYDCGATVKLRYPKNQSGGIIKMKGNIEGNATKFTFGYDVTHLLPRNVIIYKQKTITPVAVPFVSSQKDELGFGAAARAVGTPAYFNLTVDAEYNAETETITMFYNDALIDFSPAVANKGLLVVVAAGIPIIKFIDFPINKMGKSFGATLKRNPEFKVTGGGKLFAGNGTMSIGPGSEIDHKANFTIKGQKD